MTRSIDCPTRRRAILRSRDAIDFVINLPAAFKQHPARRPASRMKTMRVIATSGRFTGMMVGSIRERPDGFHFIPHYQGKPSRKGWPTPEAAVKGRLRGSFRLEEIGAERPASQGRG